MPPPTLVFEIGGCFRVHPGTTRVSRDQGFDLKNRTDWPLQVNFPPGVIKGNAALKGSKLAGLLPREILNMLATSVGWVSRGATEHFDFEPGAPGAFEYTVMVGTKDGSVEAIANSKPIVIIDP